MAKGQPQASKMSTTRGPRQVQDRRLKDALTKLTSLSTTRLAAGSSRFSSQFTSLHKVWFACLTRAMRGRIKILVTLDWKGDGREHSSKHEGHPEQSLTMFMPAHCIVRIWRIPKISRACKLSRPCCIQLALVPQSRRWVESRSSKSCTTSASRRCLGMLDATKQNFALQQAPV